MWRPEMIYWSTVGLCVLSVWLLCDNSPTTHKLERASQIRGLLFATWSLFADVSIGDG